MESHDHPKALITKRLVTRGIVAIVLLVALILGINAIRRVEDVDLPAVANTKGMVAAIRRMPNGGAQAVLVKPDGTLVESSGYREGAQDRDLVWRADGNRLFFSSDREANAVHIYRWNPASNRAERRTIEAGTYTHGSFSASGTKGGLLVERGGRLVEFDPVEGTTKPILPGPASEAVQSGNAEESGASGSFEALYGTLGTSIREGRWLKDRKWIALILRRERGELLLLQSMEAPEAGEPTATGLRRPQVIAAADRIEMDVNPKTGEVVFALLGFRFPGEVPPEFIKNGKVVPPVRHYVGIFDPANPQPKQILGSRDNANAFGSPRLSPDGSTLLLIGGKYASEGEIDPLAIVSVPAREGAANSVALLRVGGAAEPSWSADGKTIVFAERGGSGRNLKLIGADGSNERMLVEGNFDHPAFSPQG